MRRKQLLSIAATAVLTTGMASASTIVADSFNGSTTGNVNGILPFAQGLPGLGQAGVLSAGTDIAYGLTSDLQGQGTIEMWLDPANYAVGIMDFNWYDTTSAPSSGYVLHLGLDATGHVTIGGWAWDPSDMYAMASSASVPLDAWSHVALSWSASGARILIDGVLSASSDQPWQPASPAWAFLNYYGATNLGNVDELKISDVQLSDAQIFEDAQLPATAPEPSTWGLLGLGLVLIGRMRRRSAGVGRGVRACAEVGPGEKAGTQC